MTTNDPGFATLMQPPITWVDVARRLSVLEPTDLLWQSKPTALLGVDVDWLSATFYVTDVSEESAVLTWLGELFPSRVKSGQYLLLDGPGTSSQLAIEFEEVEERSPQTRISLGNIEGKVRFERAPLPNATRAIPLIACHSVKGGTGRTTTAIALATLLSKRTDKSILVVDADLEAPGLSYLFRASRPESLVSLEDVVALAHAEGDTDYPQTVTWAANLLQAHRLGTLVILPLRRMLGELASSAIRAEHLSSDKHPFALADLLEKIGIAIGCGAVVIDVRAGLVPIAAQLVLDPSVSRVFVTSLAGQSLEATEGLVAFVAREMRKSHVLASPPLLVVNRIPGILRDLGQDEGILSPILEQIEKSLLAEHMQEAASDEAVLDNAVELNPLFVAKLGEVSDLQTPSSRWEGFSDQLVSSGFLQRLEPQVEAWLDLMFDGRDQLNSSLTSQVIPSPDVDGARRKLENFASNLVEAENADKPVNDPLITRPMRALAMETTQVPVVVIEGAKGTGKTLTARFLISRYTLGGLARSAGVGVPTVDAALLPVLGSIQASDNFLREIDDARRSISANLGNGEPQLVGDSRGYIREKLRQNLSEREWLDIWLDVIGWSAGITPGVQGSGQLFIEQLRKTGTRIVAIVEGIEETYESTATPSVATMLRSILIDLPIKLRSEPGRPLGLLVFARRDSVSSGVQQNLSQFRSQYKDFALTWNEGDVLELAAWIATKSEALNIWDRNFASLPQEEKERLLFKLWGRKLGPDDQPGRERVKEAYTAGWVVAALSDLQGRLVARDLVRFLQFAAGTAVTSDSYVGRLLAPSALKSAIGPTSKRKVAETEEEIQDLAAVFDKFRAAQNSVKAPIDQTALNDLALSIEDIDLLRLHGIILGESPPYEVPELFRMGLGLRHAGARHSVLGTRRRARQRLKDTG